MFVHDQVGVVAVDMYPDQQPTALAYEDYNGHAGRNVHGNS